MKNLAGATDYLVSIMASHSKASLTTMKLVKVYSLHVIQKKVSLVEYSLKNSETWKVVECGSAAIPLMYAHRKKQMTKAYELFGYSSCAI